MELHWESLSENRSVSVVAPGMWFELVDRKSVTKYESGDIIHYDTYLYLYDRCNRIQLSTPDQTKDKNKHVSNIEYCKKYAFIIASSFLGSQHPYRDYPRNL